MRRNRHQLYISASFRHLQPRKASAPLGDGGATPTPTADNGNGGQGNLGGDPANTGGDSNNGGDTFDPSTFWDSPDPTPTPAPSAGESAGGGSQGPGTGSQGGGFAEQLTQQLSGMTFGDPVFTDEISREVAEGNFTGFEKRLQSQMQTSVRQALAMQVQILRPFAEQIMNQMRNEFGSNLNERDNVEALTRDFPAAKNPAVAPIIKGIYDQALVRNNGNREAAVKQTKQMIAHMAGATADDLELNVAPRGAGDSRPQSPAVNWLDELTGR